MFEGRVNLVKRNKLIHCGFKINRYDGTYIVSACNGAWDCKDKVSEGNASEVTCKRCKKLLEKADEKGNVKL